jgi:hypothetical protein
MPNAKKMRYNYIDILKTYAVFMMIIGHTLDAILAPAVKSLGAYQSFSFIFYRQRFRIIFRVSEQAGHPRVHASDPARG